MKTVHLADPREHGGAGEFVWMSQNIGTSSLKCLPMIGWYPGRNYAWRPAFATSLGVERAVSSRV